MTPTRRCVTILFATLLVGAVGIAAGHADTADHTSTELSFYGCTALYGLVGVPYSEAEAITPDGVTPNSLDGSDVLATTAVLGQQCARMTSNTGIDVTDYTELLYLILVTPDPEYEIPGGGIHAVPFYFKTDQPSVAEVYGAWQVGSSEASEILVASTRDAAGVPWVGQAAAPADGTGLQVATTLDGVFAGVAFRLYGTDGSGTITNMADYEIFAGRSSIGSVNVAFPVNAPVTPVEDAGVGSTYWWDEDVLTQTMRYTSAP